jgi:hypothetical protein
MSGRIKAVILNDLAILPWARPLPKGILSKINMGCLDGETKPIGYLGFENFKIAIGQYLVFANSARYLADISRLSDQKVREGDLTNPFVRSVLFSGGIQIYEQTRVPGTNFTGLDLVADGKIWSAGPFHERKYTLRNLVLGEDRNKRHVLERVAGIVEGYRVQEKERINDSARALHA